MDYISLLGDWVYLHKRNEDTTATVRPAAEPLYQSPVQVARGNIPIYETVMYSIEQLKVLMCNHTTFYKRYTCTMLN